MRRPPRTITVLGQKFDVQVAGRDDPMARGAPHDTLGRTHLDEQHIAIRYVGVEGVGPDVQRETMLHETLHAIFHLFGIEDHVDDGEGHAEKVIDVLAPALLFTLRSNPVLVDYLMEKS